MLVGALEDPQDVFEMRYLLLRILVRTPIAPVIILTIGLRLSFKHLVVVQSVCTFVTLPWIWSLAAACRSNSNIADAIGRVSVQECNLQ